MAAVNKQYGDTIKQGREKVVEQLEQYLNSASSSS